MIKQLIQQGLGGVPGKITSTPAGHLSTLCNQMVNFLGIMQNEWAGAQAFSSFDTYLAPFVKVDNLTYKQVKQCIQSFIFGVNTPSRWGTQAPFTNITLDWTVPEDLKNLPAIVGVNPKTEKEETRNADPNGPFAALAFKIAVDPFVGKLTFIKVYSGTLKTGTTIWNVKTEKRERVAKILQMHSNKQQPLESVEAGNIVALVGMKEIQTGDTITDDKHPIILENIVFPEPVISIAVEPKTKDEEEKLMSALNRLADEDPTFTVRVNEESGQTIISGMGELHLDILLDRLKREFNVECNHGKPRVAYKEEITQPIRHREVYKKQSGGRGSFADIEFELSPLPLEQQGLQFESKVAGGNIPKEFIPAIEKGFKQAMTNGVMAGFPLENLKVTVWDGSYHSVDSDALAFEICAKIGFREACRKVSSIILEPIMNIEIDTPDEYIGNVTSDLNRRRAVVEQIEAKIGRQLIKAQVPLAEMFGYVTSLRSLTSGRATFSMEFLKYEQVTADIQDYIMNVGRYSLL